MTTQIETLEEAIEAGLQISATYVPSGETVKVLDLLTRPFIEFQDASQDEVDRNDLTGFTWE